MLGKKRNVINLLVTLSIIVGLMIAGPVSAVRLDLKPNKAIYNKNDDTVVIKASVDIQRGEQVPVKDLTLRINDGFKVCNFNVDGSSSCPNISITLLNPGILGDGNLNGEGFGFVNPGDDPSTEDTDFGFGYGFDEQNHKSGLNGELLYEIQWMISSEEVPNGKYEAELEAFAENDGNKFTYITKRSKKFNIKLAPKAKPKEVNEVEVKAEGIDIDHIGVDDDFTREDADFTTKIKLLDNGEVRGRTAMNAYGETPDGTKVRLQLQMTKHTALDFTMDRIEIEGVGSAKIKYNKNPPHSPGEIERDDISVSFIIEDGKVMVSSVDPNLPFEIEFLVNKFDWD